MAGRIVVGIDGSETSRHALRWAADEARVRGARLEVAMAWHLPDAAAAPSVNVRSGDEIEADVLAEVEKLVAEEGLTEGGDPRTSVRALGGPAAEQLVQEATGADLLVVGSRGRGAFRGMLLGSVSLHCASHATCPVVVVRGPADGD